ncbi:MAG: hypothetical protein HC849_12945 [Oscillatoriales cyanobacterium RU_3_3]|nr:hypothetical protein [Microcoleus sp. SU_5_6]NJL65894.1 hypothetical protein [Microcoleus sp. SM1_3_4]NJM60901.1 hypothetical protein [Oscillatoriales cyanobacterium RU_3_3]NJR21738.1 hypothetical protein [Richelia sp. CSU_2_1]
MKQQGRSTLSHPQIWGLSVSTVKHSRSIAFTTVIKTIAVIKITLVTEQYLGNLPPLTAILTLLNPPATHPFRHHQRRQT